MGGTLLGIKRQLSQHPDKTLTRTLAMDYQPSRRLSSSACSVASNSSWTSHEDPSPPATSRRCSVRFFTYQRDGQPSTSSTSSRSCEGMSKQATRELWRCMLGLQQRYGCYKSTRIDLAVNAGEAGIDLMPNPFIIDTLNDSLVDLPDEGWEMLDRCLRATNNNKEPRTKPKSQEKHWPRT